MWCAGTLEIPVDSHLLAGPSVDLAGVTEKRNMARKPDKMRALSATHT
jgi:hypothetical protein